MKRDAVRIGRWLVTPGFSPAVVAVILVLHEFRHVPCVFALAMGSLVLLGFSERRVRAWADRVLREEVANG